MKPHAESVQSVPAAAAVRATLLSAVLPGAGQLLLGARAFGAGMLALFAALAALVITHFARGLRPFETYLGSFVFAVALRALIVLHFFAALDAYRRAVEPPSIAHHARLSRAAVLLNIVLPGSGYLLARTWIRVATGGGVVLAVLYAAQRPSRVIDVAFIAVQGVMALSVYQHLARQRAGEHPPTRTAVREVPLCQITLLVLFVVCATGIGWTVRERFPSYALSGVSAKDIEIHPRAGGIALRVPPLGLSLTAVGSGWIEAEHRPGALLYARHRQGVTLRAGAELLIPFLRFDRYTEQLKRRMAEGGYRYRATRQLANGATQLRFERRRPDATIDRWVIARSKGDTAYLLIISGPRASCKALLPALEKTRDSFQVQ